MRCFLCKLPTERNVLDGTDEELEDLVIEYYVLGTVDLRKHPEDVRDEHGWICVCQSCVDAVPKNKDDWGRD
jgi:hypothetical protein